MTNDEESRSVKPETSHLAGLSDNSIFGSLLWSFFRTSAMQISEFPSFPSVLIFVLLLVTTGLSARADTRTPKRGGTLRLARLFDPQTLDAIKINMAEDNLLVHLLYQTLLDVRDGTNLFPGAAR